MAAASRRHTLISWLGRGIGALTAGYLGLVTLVGSRRLIRPGRRPLEPFEGWPATPADLGLDYETVRFTTDDGVTLDGWFVPARRETRAAVVVMHGFGWHRLGELAAFVPWLAERYNVLQFDFRGHGASGDADITLGAAEQRDIAAAVRLLEGRGLGPIALMGVSMGAASAIVAAPDLPVAAVVADSAYADLYNPIANRMRDMHYPLPWLSARIIVAAAALRTRMRLRMPRDRVAQIAPRALLLIGPRDDDLIDHGQTLRLYRDAREPKELYVVEGAGHGEARAVAGDAYVRRVLDFLARWLDGAPPSVPS
jgi:dipeptidyl aminopeptidase/acylaminoacyl peptidase